MNHACKINKLPFKGESDTFYIEEADNQRAFVIINKLTVEMLLRRMSVVEECKSGCLEGDFIKMGRNCKAGCEKRRQQALSDEERTLIVFSLLYVDLPANKNLHPDVRALLWLRASGASQYIATFDGYPSRDKPGTKSDYYKALKNSVTPVNPSVVVIENDKSRRTF